MKDVSEIVCAVVDYGTFTDVAVRLSQSVKKQYYHTPIQDEFLDIKKCVLGYGIPKVILLDDFMHPDIVEEVDLWVFPDIGFGGHQKYLRSIGKAVWGSMGVDEYELYRTRFLGLIKEIGLPMVPYEKVVGVSSLADYLKGVTNKWVKVNRYRANMETWKHIDYEHSIPELNRLAMEFGGVADEVVFVVQDEIETSVEIGYDGWCVHGQFPKSSFQGYEKKNELYLGSKLEYEELPEAVQRVNESMSPLLEERGYANFIATEIRWVSDEEFYFIDPTMRMPGQTGEQLLTTCENLPEVMWNGANAEPIDPEWRSDFAAEATVHHSGEFTDWRVLKVPEEINEWFKPLKYCLRGGLLHYPPHRNDEVGVLIGQEDSIEDSIDKLKEHFKLFENEPVSIRDDLFKDLLESITEAESKGVEFTDQKIPKPESVI